ncbi:MAG: symmetrical bis(5'-nucleosyl)-tetraphosphatase [Gammaproteobacteria bacterium]|nr:MAG: symmetrical bis(5'-nucleosyl)-tetraphosphatase [Gammaproteobacteria bacterium]
MSLFAIGDIHGCYETLRRLLDKIGFNETKDTLWFTGDLVGRGPQSLETLRFLKSINNSIITVLGNHDLHLLSLYYQAKEIDDNSSELKDILNAPDSEILIDWLRKRPLVFYDRKKNYILVHAGIHPRWTINESIKYASEVEAILRSDHCSSLLKNMYGNTPTRWSTKLNGYDRNRFIINTFTRMRVLDDKDLNLKYKGKIPSKNNDLRPWFDVIEHKWKDTSIIFGHWSALGLMIKKQFICLDSGCAWGGDLTAIELNSKLTQTKVSYRSENPI